MSVSIIRRFWDKRSLIFKVLIVIMVMVPLGVYNLVGASLIVFDDIDSDATTVKTNETEDSSNYSEYESESLNSETDSILFFVDTYN